MTIRDALSELKVSMFLFTVALIALGVAAYFTYTSGEPGGSSCLAYRGTGYFCGANYVAYWWVAAVFTTICSIAAAVLALMEGVGAFHEERHVDYVIAVVCLMPLAALIAISLSAS
jgi:hypothetical protein